MDYAQKQQQAIAEVQAKEQKGSFEEIPLDDTKPEVKSENFFYPPLETKRNSPLSDYFTSADLPLFPPSRQLTSSITCCPSPPSESLVSQLYSSEQKSPSASIRYATTPVPSETSTITAPETLELTEPDLPAFLQQFLQGEEAPPHTDQTPALKNSPKAKEQAHPPTDTPQEQSSVSAHTVHLTDPILPPVEVLKSLLDSIPPPKEEPPQQAQSEPAPSTEQSTQSTGSESTSSLLSSKADQKCHLLPYLACCDQCRSPNLTELEEELDRLK